MLKFRMTSFILIALLITGCSLHKGKEAQNVIPPNELLIDGNADVMLFSGKGEWVDEGLSIRKLLFDNQISYKVVTPTDLNNMSLGDMIKYKLLIMPGGDSDLFSATLYTDTGIALRAAVQQHGLSYLGFCAGAWMAVAPKPAPGLDPIYGLGLVDGQILSKEPALKEIHTDKFGKKYSVPIITLADGTKRRLLWYGGPITPEAKDAVVARFEDGSPAISQMKSGKGTVILSGVHPAANKHILSLVDMYVKEAIAPALTLELIRSGISKNPLNTFK